MTRVNVVPVAELSDQHLFAEFREIKMVPKSLARSLRARGLAGVLAMVPPAYCLGAGHVSFFYDKYLFLVARYWALRQELTRRGVNYNLEDQLDRDGLFHGAYPELQNGWVPTDEAIALNRARIAERVAKKPEWYRHTKPR